MLICEYTMFFLFVFSCLLVFVLGIKKNNNTQFDAHCILEHLVSSMERLEVNIWKYEAPLCVCVSLSLSLHVYVCVCVRMLPNDKMGAQSSR